MCYLAEYLPKMLMLIHVPHALASVVGSRGPYGESVSFWILLNVQRGAELRLDGWRARAFSFFFRLDQSQKDSFRSDGLGLT